MGTIMKLWVDDLRTPPNGYDLWAKNYEEAVAFIDKYSQDITHISFDHDIDSFDENGNELTGYAVAVYIEQQIYYGDFNAIVLQGIQVHTSNPSGSKKILAFAYHIKDRFNNDLQVYHAPYESMGECDSFGLKK